MTIADWYAVSKAMHLIGMVSWMAGVFYLVRIMVYHAEAGQKQGAERDILTQQYALMEQKAYRIIVQPAVILTWSFGVTMLCLQPAWFSQGWMHGKLLLLILFTGYTHWCKSQIRLLAERPEARPSVFYRGMNEVPTILLAGIVFLAVMKQNINWAYWGIGLGAFAGLIFYAVRKVARRAARQ